MAETTQAALRKMLAPRLQEYHAGTTTSAGAAGQLVDTALKDYPDGHWDEAYVKLLGGTYSGEVRRIKNSAQSTGFLTPYNDFGGAPGSGVSYELHKQFSPDRLDTAIQDAVRQAYPHLFQHQEIKDICVGSRLKNGSFEDWTKRITGTGLAFVDSNPDTITDSGTGFVTAGFEAGDTISVAGSVLNNGVYTIATVAAATLTLVASDALFAEIAGDSVTISVDWVHSETITATEDTAASFHGESCAKLVATGAGQFYQEESPAYASREFLLLDDSSVVFYAWVWCDAASRIRLYITDPDGTTYGDYHTGGGGWERLSVTRTINATGTVIFGFDIAGAETVFVDAANITGGPTLYDYAIPSTFVGQPLVVAVQRAISRPEGAYRWLDPGTYEVITLTGGGRHLRFTRQGKPPDGYWLRVRGLAYLSALSADTDTVEVGAPQTEIIIAQAVVNLLQSRPFGEPSMSEATYQQALAQWQWNLQDAKRRYRMKMPERSLISRAW